MTLKQYLEQNNLNLVDDRGDIVGCPSDYPCLDVFWEGPLCTNKYLDPTLEKCRICWNQPYKDPIVKLIDGLEMLSFFNQRAGRELWNDKSTDLQNVDIDNADKYLTAAIKILEKQVPKKIELFNGQCSCPNCKKLFGNYNDLKDSVGWDMLYCKYCGQKLDWSEEEE